jgi:hypothetical protein
MSAKFGGKMLVASKYSDIFKVPLKGSGSEH